LAVERGDCTFVKWNASHFCSLIKSSTIAIIGNTASWEQYASLVLLLGEHESETYLFGRNEGQTIPQYVCQGQARLVFLRDDHLKQLGEVLNATLPDILIFNQGTAYDDDAHLVANLQRVITDLLRWQDLCETMHQRCHLVLQTSVPGHPKCWTFTEPGQRLEEMESYIANRSNYNEMQWALQWHNYQHQNNLTLRILGKIDWRVRFDVMDAYYINILRPDERLGDCVHSCFPGKVDVYNQLLLHVLQRREGNLNVSLKF
jgi:hypothetical protein